MREHPEVKQKLANSETAKDEIVRLLKFDSNQNPETIRLLADWFGAKKLVAEQKKSFSKKPVRTKAEFNVNAIIELQ